MLFDWVLLNGWILIAASSFFYLTLTIEIVTKQSSSFDLEEIAYWLLALPPLFLILLIGQRLYEAIF